MKAVIKIFVSLIKISDIVFVQLLMFKNKTFAALQSNLSLSDSKGGVK